MLYYFAAHCLIKLNTTNKILVGHDSKFLKLLLNILQIMCSEGLVYLDQNWIMFFDLTVYKVLIVALVLLGLCTHSESCGKP